jgi:hypothetical protein
MENMDDCIGATPLFADDKIGAAPFLMDDKIGALPPFYGSVTIAWESGIL